jgi:hypothetical protein
MEEATRSDRKLDLCHSERTEGGRVGVRERKSERWGEGEYSKA